MELVTRFKLQKFITPFQLKTVILTPNLVILGAQKSGTTSLHHYLDQHPDIFMSKPIKEPGFFLNEKNAISLMKKVGININSRKDLLDNHMINGYDNEKYFGDSSTYYTLGKRSRQQNIPKRMRQMIGPNKAKFIYLLRDPIKRLESNYLHMIQKKYIRDDVTFKTYLKMFPDAILTSMYSYQLDHYLQFFPKNSFLILLFEELTIMPKKSLEKVSSFLDVSMNEIKLGITRKKFNVSKVRSQINENKLESQINEMKSYLIKEIKPDIEKLKENFHLPEINNHWNY